MKGCVCISFSTDFFHVSLTPTAIVIRAPKAEMTMRVIPKGSPKARNSMIFGMQASWASLDQSSPLHRTHSRASVPKEGVDKRTAGFCVRKVVCWLQVCVLKISKYLSGAIIYSEIFILTSCVADFAICTWDTVKTTDWFSLSYALPGAWLAVLTAHWSRWLQHT